MDRAPQFLLATHFPRWPGVLDAPVYSDRVRTLDSATAPGNPDAGEEAA
jgi:hypothetical protein